MRLRIAGLTIAALSSAGAAVGQVTALVPRTAIDGPVFRFDFPGLEIGVAEYDEGPTGATVFHFPKTVRGAVDVRGGAPGTINTDALRLGYDAPFVNAIAFGGGSSYGLSVATGAAAEIKSRSTNPGDWNNIAFVAGAIIFDLGGRRFTSVTPDFELGRAALKAARPNEFPQGAHGAGRFAMQGWLLGGPQHSGQGAAFRQIGPTKIAVFTVVNALGSIVDRTGRLVRCAVPNGGPCDLAATRIDERLKKLEIAATDGDNGIRGSTQNTTITLVVVNQKIPLSSLQRLAVQVHTSMARAIQPFATEQDGDALYAVTTDAVENPKLTDVDLGVAAAEVAWDAILATVPPLEQPPTTRAISDTTGLNRLAGTYELAPGARTTITASGGQLVLAGPDRPSIYFEAKASVKLIRIGPNQFLIPGPRADWLQFDGPDGGPPTGLTINPGAWPIRATRVRP